MQHAAHAGDPQAQIAPRDGACHRVCRTLTRPVSVPRQSPGRSRFVPIHRWRGVRRTSAPRRQTPVDPVQGLRIAELAQGGHHRATPHVAQLAHIDTQVMKLLQSRIVERARRHRPHLALRNRRSDDVPTRRRPHRRHHARAQPRTAVARLHRGHGALPTPTHGQRHVPRPDRHTPAPPHRAPQRCRAPPGAHEGLVRRP